MVWFYNGRGTAEQWIKEGKNAVKWTRLSCHDFVDNQVRLQLFALAYNLGNFLRRLALPTGVKHWTLTTLREKLIKIGAKVVRHSRYVFFQMHGTTVLCVARDGKVAMAADGQVTLGETVLKHAPEGPQAPQGPGPGGLRRRRGRRLRPLHPLRGQAGGVRGNLERAAVELVKEWRTDRALRRLEAMLIVADREHQLLLSGSGELIAPDDGVFAIGSGRPLRPGRGARPDAAHQPRRPRDRRGEPQGRRRDLHLHQRPHHRRSFRRQWNTREDGTEENRGGAVCDPFYPCLSSLW